MTVRVAGVAATLGLDVYLARTYGPEVYGIFATALSLGAILAVTAPWGWHHACVRFFQQHASENRYDLSAGVLRAALLAVALGVGVTLALWLLGTALGDFEAPTELAIQNAVIIGGCLAFAEVARSALRATGREAAGESVRMLATPVAAILAVSLFAPDGAEGVSWAYAACALCAAAAAGAAAIRQTGGASPTYAWRKWVPVAGGMAFMGVAGVAMQRVDVALVGILGGPEAAASYQAAARVAFGMMFFARTAHAALGPTLARAYFDGDFRRFKRTYLLASAVSLAGSAPILLLCLAIPQAVLATVFGSSYADGADVLRALAVGYAFVAASGCAPLNLALIGGHRFVTVATVSALAAQVLGAWAVSGNGGENVAWVVAASVGGLNVAALAAVARRVRRKERQI